MRPAEFITRLRIPGAKRTNDPKENNNYLSALMFYNFDL